MSTFLKTLAAVVLAGAMFVWAMPASAAESNSAGMPMYGPLSQVVMQAYTAYVNGNIDGIVELTTDDVDWGGVGPADFGAPFGQFWGHDGVSQWFAKLAADSDPYMLTDLQFHEDGDSVFVTGMQSTRFKATGMTESGPFVHAFKFRDGKIIWFRIYMDSAALIAAAGKGMQDADESQANIGRVQAAYAAFGSGDLDGLMDYFTDDIRWELSGPQEENPLLGVWQGKPAVRAWFEMLGDMVDLQPFSDLEFLADGDTVVVLGNNTSRYRKTGLAETMPFVHIFKFRNGKVYWFREAADSYAEVMRFKASISEGPPGVEIMRY